MQPLDLDGLQLLLWNFASHRVVTVAARTGVLRRLANGRARAEDVARELDLDPYATGKVIRALTALGLLTAEEDLYRVADALAPHFREGPDDISDFFDHSHSMYEGWGKNLEPWLRGEGWATHARGPEELRRFGAAMRAMGTQGAKKLAARFDLSELRHLLDVGGGFGHFARVLCDANPGLHATVLDVPEVADMARSELRGSGMQDRISFVGGDYLDSDYGSGFDLVLFANVLHQETRERAAQMIRQGATSLVPAGRLMVLDFQIDDAQREQLLGTLFAVNMRSFGDTHTEPSIRAWIKEAGLVDVERVDLDRYRWVIVGHRAS